MTHIQGKSSALNQTSLAAPSQIDLEVCFHGDSKDECSRVTSGLERFRAASLSLPNSRPAEQCCCGGEYSHCRKEGLQIQSLGAFEIGSAVDSIPVWGSLSSLTEFS